MDADRIFSHIGDFGSQQAKYVFALIFFRVFRANMANSYIFLAMDLPFECTTRNGSVLHGQCDEEQCVQLSFDTTAATSIISEWELVCGRQWLAPLTLSSRLAGTIVGVFVSGCLSDKYGRKSALLLCLLTVMASNQTGAMVPWFPAYCLCQFINGFAMTEVPLVLLANELVGGPKRNQVALLFAVGFSLGIGLLSLLAFLIRSWRYLDSAYTLVGLVPLSVLCFIPESPRWLLRQERQDEAMEVFQKIARGNGKVIHEQELFSLHEKEVILKPKPLSKKEQSSGAISFVDLFKHCYIILIIMTLIYSWAIANILYLGLTILAGMDGGSKYIATVVNGMVDIPGDLFGVILVQYIGRRNISCISLLITGLSMTIVYLSSPQPFVLMLFLGLAKMGASCSCAILTVYTNELFPTDVRGRAYGFIQLTARLISVSTPYILLLGQIHHNLQYLLLGLFTILAGLVCLLILPETSGKPMPESIQDLLDTKRNRVCAKF